jgi:lipid II:glycine glycyltransferase (peptidoglycan interpeptide bridge formation enzyme)
VTNKAEAKDRINKISQHPLQTWQWGQFRREWGNIVDYTSHGQIIFSKIPKTDYTVGTFIKGPKPTPDLLDELKSAAIDHKALFVKLEPAAAKKELGEKESAKCTKVLKENGAVEGKTLFTPTTFWIDLAKSEEELLRSFSSKTRYNIRLAQKHGVSVTVNNSDSAFEKYLALTRATVARQGFYAHTQKYHRLMWKHLHTDMVENKEEPIAHLLTAVYKKEIITTWILFIWKGFIYYPYGASTDKFKNVMANNLMMLEAIRLGKKHGCKTFDLWGREPGKGFTKFKEGYNPEVVEFLGSWDLITSNLYYPYRLTENLRWFLLRIKAKLVPVTARF